MKTKTILITLIAMLAITALIFQSCKKDDDPNNEQINEILFEEAYPDSEGDTISITFDGDTIVCEFINGEYVYQGDMIIVPDPTSSIKGAGINATSKRWPNRTIYYAIDSNLPKTNRVTGAIAHWENETDIIFIERTDEVNYIDFIRVAQGVSSNVGMIGGKQEIKMSDLAGMGNIIHEIGHAVGLYHEHSKKNRNDFVIIKWDNIKPSSKSNFFIKRNSIITDGFDFGSIMLYNSFAFSKNGEPTITKNDGTTFPSQRVNLSLVDIEMVDIMYNNLGNIPIAEFSANITSGTAPLAVVFTDQSTNSPTSWQWDFGDESTSTQQNPSHTYNTDGSYTVTLTATNGNGSNVKTKPNYIVVTEGGGDTPIADFTADITSGEAPLIVNFTDQSENDPTTWQWDFGNGSTSTQQNPSYTYNTAGTYTVTLTATNGNGSNVKTKTNYIVVSEGGTGTFTDPRDGHTYTTVDNGSQTWFAENLNYETSNSWWYDNSSANGDVYGRLYTWEAALTACPIGWHLPSDDEWKILEMHLGMSQSEADSPGWRGTDEAEKMKSVSGWNNNGNGTNSSGFNALPGGWLTSDGSFAYLGDGGYWWSSSEYSGVEALYRGMDYEHDQVVRWSFDKAYGRSVRCLKN